LGFRFRRSLRIIPGLRLNLSRSGASVSLGGRGFHYTVGSKGTRTTIGLPGSGISWSNYQPYNRPSQPLAEPEQSTEYSPIESGPTDQIAGRSTSELAPILNRVRKRIPFGILTGLGAVIFTFVGPLSGNAEWIFLSLAWAICTPPIMLFDHYRRSIQISYFLDHETAQKYESLENSFEEVKNSGRIWHVRAEGSTSDWKRNAGANTLIKRSTTTFSRGRPRCFRGNISFPSFRAAGKSFFLTPDAILIE
jgi:Protein of unknown function (DUF4236)